METIIAVAIAVGVLKGQSAPRVEPPKVTVACDAAWQRDCPREKVSSKAKWELGY